MNTPPVPDVLIAGAGPVGLLLACELALAGCSVLVLEKAESPHSPLKQLPFGIRGLSAPTIEALDYRGLLQDLELHKQLRNPHKTAAPEQGPRRQVGHFAGIPFHEGDVDSTRWPWRLPASTPASLISEMQELESLLSRRAVSLGVVIRRGCALQNFQQDEDGVTVQAGDEFFRGKWLVGCDGARSVVRKTAGFEFAGTEPEFTGYSTQIDMADPSLLKPGRNMTATGMYLQSQPGFVVMQDFDGGAFHDSGKPVTREHVQETLRRISGSEVIVTALHAASTWTDRARQTTAYRKGRIFLAGDAAHIHSPLGGQGLNLGLGDAMNLGWKLAATLQGKACDALLDSYQAERWTLGEQVLDWSRAQVAIMKPTASARALNAIFRDLLNTQDGATYMAGRVWGIDTRYPLAGHHALTGHRVPAFRLADGRRVGELMRSGHWLLLDFCSIRNNSKLGDIAAEFGDSIITMTAQASEPPGITALLLRPDGFIAWASSADHPDGDELRQAAAHCLSR